MLALSFITKDITGPRKTPFLRDSHFLDSSALRSQIVHQEVASECQSDQGELYLLKEVLSFFTFHYISLYNYSLRIFPWGAWVAQAVEL